MKTKQTIEIEGLPEGWKAIAIRKALDTDTHVFVGGEVFEISKHPEMLNPKNWSYLIVEKIQPRRIVDIDENALNESGWAVVQKYGEIVGECMGRRLFNNLKPVLKIAITEYLRLREVKETDLSLNNDEPKLSLSVAECKALIAMHWSTVNKIREFIKDK